MEGHSAPSQANYTFWQRRQQEPVSLAPHRPSPRLDVRSLQAGRRASSRGRGGRLPAPQAPFLPGTSSYNQLLEDLSALRKERHPETCFVGWAPPPDPSVHLQTPLSICPFKYLLIKYYVSGAMLSTKQNRPPPYLPSLSFQPSVGEKEGSAAVTQKLHCYQL